MPAAGATREEMHLSSKPHSHSSSGSGSSVVHQALLLLPTHSHTNTRTQGGEVWHQLQGPSRAPKFTQQARLQRLRREGFATGIDLFTEVCSGSCRAVLLASSAQHCITASRQGSSSASSRLVAAGLGPWLVPGTSATKRRQGQHTVSRNTCAAPVCMAAAEAGCACQHGQLGGARPLGSGMPSTVWHLGSTMCCS